MYFLIDNKKKIIFGWSPKCGCTHIKKIYKYLTESINLNKVHEESDYKNELPVEIENYTTIIFIRNPYERIVSGFLDRYRPSNGTRKYRWKDKTITFENFVNELINENWKAIDKHHFSCQTDDKYNNAIMKSKQLIVYDLKEIDYYFLGNLYNKNIPDEIINYRGNHKRKRFIETINDFVFNVDMPKYYRHNVDLKYFYNDEIRENVYKFYKEDFELFKTMGFCYDVLITD